jgi:hypothetical protein
MEKPRLIIFMHTKLAFMSSSRKRQAPVARRQQPDRSARSRHRRIIEDSEEEEIDVTSPEEGEDESKSIAPVLMTAQAARRTALQVKELREKEEMVTLHTRMDRLIEKEIPRAIANATTEGQTIIAIVAHRGIAPAAEQKRLEDFVRNVLGGPDCCYRWALYSRPAGVPAYRDVPFCAWIWWNTEEHEQPAGESPALENLYLKHTLVSSNQGYYGSIMSRKPGIKVVPVFV